MRTATGVLLAFCCLATTLRVAADTDVDPISLSDLLRLTGKSQQSKEKDAAIRLRDEQIRDAAMVVGVRGGFSYRARELRTLLEQRSDKLDRVFTFGPLVQYGRILAPVVELVEQVQAIDGDGTAMRETARVLRVTKPARLVTVQPTWRDWLTIMPMPVDADDTVLLPESDHDIAVWRESVRQSWAIGVKQADSVYLADLAVLTRDYEGMLRYRDLLVQGIVSPAEIGRSDLGIVREDAELRIGDNIYTIRSSAVFTEPEKWKPVVHPIEGESP